MQNQITLGRSFVHKVGLKFSFITAITPIPLASKSQYQIPKQPHPT